jgi:hypothetical protein
MSPLRAVRAVRALTRPFTTSAPLSARNPNNPNKNQNQTVDSSLLSSITAAEKPLTSHSGPVPGGPTARAQSHANTPLTADVVRDVSAGERAVTGSETNVRGGPAAVAQAAFTKAQKGEGQQGGVGRKVKGEQGQEHNGVLDSETMATITEREREITGSETPVRGGPTAAAQKHAGEPIGSQVLSEITRGEKKVTGGERVKGGPTSAAQSELAKSRE